jgi:membrane protein required for colicin V production
MPLELAWVDIGLLVFLLLSIAVGLVRGVVFELLSLAGWFVAYFAAVVWSPWAQGFITLGGAGSALNHAIAFAAVFFVALVIWGLGARVVRGLVRATPLSALDRFFGAAFGLVRGGVVLLLVAALVGITPLAQTSDWRQSRGAGWLNALLQELRPWWSNEVPTGGRSA